MNKNSLILESLFLLEDTEKISARLADEFKSKGFAKAKSSMLMNTQILKAKLKEKNIDVTKIQKEAQSIAIGLRPLINKLKSNEDSDKIQTIKLILNRVNSEARTLIETNSVDKATGLYISVFFLEMLLIFIFRVLFGSGAIGFTLAAILFSPIMELILKSINADSEEDQEKKFIYSKFVYSFRLTNVFISLLIAGFLSIPISVFLVILSVLYSFYFHILSDEKLKKYLDTEHTIKLIISIFLMLLIGIFMRKIAPNLAMRVGKFINNIL